jgi:type II secretory pathway component HofQ
MHSFAIRLSCLALVLAIASPAAAAPTPKSEPRPKDLPSAEYIRKVLDARVNLEFSDANLPAVLTTLGNEHHVNFVLDRAVLVQMNIEPNEAIVDLKLKDVKLRNGLRTMLGQFNLTFAIVGDSVLVSTEEQVMYKQLKHRISVEYDNVPLNKALKDLAQVNGINVVLDPRTLKSKAAEAPVTLNVDDVPFEAVVRLMCEMAGLKPARMGNVIFVTTEDRADKLKDSDSLVPNPGLPAPTLVQSVPGFLGLAPGLGGVAPAPAPAPVEKAKQ